MWLALVVACLDDDLPERNCDERRPFWPDRDGDGLGERDEVYVGCEAPPGWVSTPAPLDHTGGGSLPRSTADTAAPASAGTGAGTGAPGDGGSGAGATPPATTGDTAGGSGRP